MKRFLALILTLLLVLPACAPDAGDSDARTLKRIGKALSLDLSAGTLERLENTHGGFHGDGRTAAELADTVVALAKQGLAQGELGHLVPLEELVSQRKTLADLESL